MEDADDSCPLQANPEQVDTDGDGSGDACDDDDDGDEVADAADSCPLQANPDQTDTDADALGDACDDDDDDDTILDADDNCQVNANPEQEDNEGDGLGDACDDDDDDDTVLDADDNCPLVSNPEQTVHDDDGLGDACDEDDDGDGVSDLQDCLPLDGLTGLCDEGVQYCDVDGCADLPGTAPESAEPSCQAIQWAFTSITDAGGTGAELQSGPGWWIEPTGQDEAEPFQVHCDFGTLGGGWTRIWYQTDPNQKGGLTWLDGVAPLLGSDGDQVEILAAFTDLSLGGVTKPGLQARFPVPPSWRETMPLAHAGAESWTTVAVHGDGFDGVEPGGEVAQGARLRFGVGSLPSGDCESPGAAEPVRGHFCLQGTHGPFVAGFANSDADQCGDSTEPLSQAGGCGATRFFLAVRDGCTAADDPFCIDSDFDSLTAMEGDCNDGTSLVAPINNETCGTEGVDDNCDGVADEANASGCATYLFDGDGDGVAGDGAESLCLCEAGQVPGYDATEAGDCYPEDPEAYPGADERCNGQNDDCDDITDEGFALETALWPGDDGKAAGETCGTGACAGGAVTCTPAGTVICSSNAHATGESCNGEDDDCDGEIDPHGASTDGTVPQWEDLDQDGYGSDVVGEATWVCPGTPKWADNELDCLDIDPDRSPDAVEACDGVDNDCDGSIDQDFVNASGAYPHKSNCGGCADQGGEDCHKIWYASDEDTTCAPLTNGGYACNVAKCDPGYSPAPGTVAGEWTDSNGAAQPLYGKCVPWPVVTVDCKLPYDVDARTAPSVGSYWDDLTMSFAPGGLELAATVSQQNLEAGDPVGGVVIEVQPCPDPYAYGKSSVDLGLDLATYPPNAPLVIRGAAGTQPVIQSVWPLESGFAMLEITRSPDQGPLTIENLKIIAHPPVVRVRGVGDDPAQQGLQLSQGVLLKDLVIQARPHAPTSSYKVQPWGVGGVAAMSIERIGDVRLQDVQVLDVSPIDEDSYQNEVGSLPCSLADGWECHLADAIGLEVYDSQSVVLTDVVVSNIRAGIAPDQDGDAWMDSGAIQSPTAFGMFIHDSVGVEIHGGSITDIVGMDSGPTPCLDLDMPSRGTDGADARGLFVGAADVYVEGLRVAGIVGGDGGKYAHSGTCGPAESSDRGGDGGGATGIDVAQKSAVTLSAVVVEVVHGGDAGYGAHVNSPLADGGSAVGVATGAYGGDDSKVYAVDAYRLLIRDLREGASTGYVPPSDGSDNWWPRAVGISLYEPMSASFNHLTIHDLVAREYAVGIYYDGPDPKGQASEPIRVTNSIFSGIVHTSSQGGHWCMWSGQPGWLEASYDLTVGCTLQEQVVTEGPGVRYVDEHPYVNPEDADEPLHIRAGAPSIDAGDPSAPFAYEPEPNGGRVNMGYYGNNAEASVTPGASKTVWEAPCADLPWVSFLGAPSEDAPCGCMNLLADVTALGETCVGLGVCGADPVTGEVIEGVIECGGGQTLCSTSPGGTVDRSGPEICDLLDNNCYGEVDEDNPDLCPNPGELCAADLGCIGIPGTEEQPAASCDDLRDTWAVLPDAATGGETLATGLYWIDPNGGDIDDAFEVHCEMGVAQGGWTRVWVAEDPDYDLPPTLYQTPASQTASLLGQANEVLIAFVGAPGGDAPGDIVDDSWASFPLPDGWRAQLPLTTPEGTDLPVTTNVGGAITAGTLRYGAAPVCANYSSNGWTTVWQPMGDTYWEGSYPGAAYSLQANGDWVHGEWQCNASDRAGRLVIAGVPQAPGFVNFGSTAPDSCSSSTRLYGTGVQPCADQGLRFAIYVRQESCPDGVFSADPLCSDQDKDGHGILTDCDDADPAQTGVEICDGLDNDCDGEADNGDLVGLCGGTGWCDGANGCQAFPGQGPEDPFLRCDTAEAELAPVAAMGIEVPPLESGTWWIDPNGGDTSDAEEVYCDFDTGPGGWTRVWIQPEANLSSAPHSYDLATGQAYSLLTGSNEVMVAFVCWAADCGGAVLPDEWASFPLPESWKADFPLDNPGTDLDIMASIAGGLVETKLRYGQDWFTDNQVCPSAWNPAGAGHGKGRICLEGTSAPALVDYVSGASGNPTACTPSTQGGWSETWPICEERGVRYAIFARHQPCAQGPATNDPLCSDQDGDGNGLLTDCDDGDPTKGIAELCDEVDNDCDGEVDEGFPVGGSCDGDDGDLCEEGTWACGSAEPHPVNWVTTAGGFVASGTYPAADWEHLALSAEPMYPGSVLEFEVADGQGGTHQSMGITTNGSTFLYELRFNGFGNPPYFTGTVVTAGSEDTFNVNAEAPADHANYVQMGDRFRMERVGNSIQYYAQWKGDATLEWHWLYGSPVSYEGVVPLYPMVKGRLVGDATLLQKQVVCVGDDPATSEEICGGVDEDCDGVEDENASVEICDDVDNDCDGDVDEDYVRKGQDCDGLDADQCENGEWVCVDSAISGEPVPLQWEGLENVEVLGDQLVQIDACGDCGFAVGATPLVGDGYLEWSSFSYKYGSIGLAYDPEVAKANRIPDFAFVSRNGLTVHTPGHTYDAGWGQSAYNMFRVTRQGTMLFFQVRESSNGLWQNLVLGDGYETFSTQPLYPVAFPDGQGDQVTGAALVQEGLTCGPEEVTDVLEVCDGVDNDCDGDVDEAGVGLCDDPVETCYGGDTCYAVPGTLENPAESCSALLAEWALLPNVVTGGAVLENGGGPWWIDPNGQNVDDAFQVQCDFEVAGGGWTRVWMAAESGLHSTYPYDIPAAQVSALLGGANEAMIAHIDIYTNDEPWLHPKDVEYAYFPMPPKWPIEAPTQAQAEDHELRYAVAGGDIRENTVLRYGVRHVGGDMMNASDNWCGLDWGDPAAPKEGRICLQGAGGLAPAYSFYGEIGQDACTTDSVTYEEVFTQGQQCSIFRRFAIFVRHQSCEGTAPLLDPLCADSDGDDVTPLGGDCDDGSAAAYPGNPGGEICGDTVDNDCDGNIDGDDAECAE